VEKLILTFVIVLLEAFLGCLMVARRFAALLARLLFADIRLVIKQALFKPKPGY
jgi:hypothetical protein